MQSSKDLLVEGSSFGRGGSRSEACAGRRSGVGPDRPSCWVSGVRLVAVTCGWLTAANALFLEGERGLLRVPVPAFLIEHPRGRVLFDTGLHPDLRNDPKGRLGTIAKLFTVELDGGHDIAGRLAAAEVAVDRVEHVVLSHLHFDHAGGLATIPNARVVVQRPDWEAGHDAGRAA